MALGSSCFGLLFLGSGSTFGSTSLPLSSLRSVPFVRARPLGLRPKENPNRERQNSAHLALRSHPRHSIGCSERTTLRPYLGPLKGVKCSRNCRRIVYKAGDQDRAGTRHRGERGTGSNPHTNPVHPSAAPPSSDPRWLSPLMIVRPFRKTTLDRFGNP